MHFFIPFLLVFIGGGLGSVCRFAVSLLLSPYAIRFPVPTLLSNAAACIVMGLILGWQIHSPLPDARRVMLATGFCGGFSTFSTFSAETVALLQTGEWTLATLNILGNLLICLFCIYLGVRIAS